MAINDALLSYLEEYENSKSEQRSKEGDLDEIVLNENVVETVRVSEDKIDSYISEEKPKYDRPFKFNINKSNKADVGESSDEKAIDIMNSIASEAIASQPKKIEHSQTKASEPTVVQEEKSEKQSNSTIDKMEKLLADARAKSKKKAEEEQRMGVDSLDEHKSLMDAIHRAEGITTVEDSEVVNTDIENDVEEQEEIDIPAISTEELMSQAETEYEDEWLEIYNKGLRSTKKNEVTNKIKRGRFRIDKDHQIEILADKRTDNKTADELLNEKWL